MLIKWVLINDGFGRRQSKVFRPLKLGVPNQGCETSFQGVQDASVLMVGTRSIYYITANKI